MLDSDQLGVWLRTPNLTARLFGQPCAEGGIEEPLTHLTSGAKLRSTLTWAPAYLWQLLTRLRHSATPEHLIIALADHFEPSIIPEAKDSLAELSVQRSRLERWCRNYPRAVDRWRDADGYPFRHTYFYPAEQFDADLIDVLVEHCQAGWGEIEVQLHHGVRHPDTAEHTRRVICEFRDALAKRGCLARLDGSGLPRYAFVHGNWALANSNSGRFCGVDEEMQILAETGCYADLTLPSAPDPAQIAKINSLYECALPLTRSIPQRRGHDLEKGRRPEVFPLIIQGPLGLNFSRRVRRWPLPLIENGELSARNPPSLQRLHLWRRATITVRGCPNWLFIKLHCHGMDPRDEAVMLGPALRQFLHELLEASLDGHSWRIHFVTAREMVNIILAACDGREGSPANFRDYRLCTFGPATRP